MSLLTSPMRRELPAAATMALQKGCASFSL